MITEKLKALKEQSGMTVAQWAETANVPADTINKIIAGTTKNPGFDTISALVAAAGGSVDELIGIKKTIPEEEGKDESVAMLKALEQAHARHTEALTDQIKDLKYSRKVLAIALAIVVLFVFGILLFDLLNGGVGYIRY